MNDGDSSLTDLRTRIEQVDRDLVHLLAERLRLVREVGEYKRARGIPIVDPAREAAVIAHVGTCARELGLPDEEVRQLFWRIMGLSRREQQAD